MDTHLKILFSRFQEQFGSGPGLGPGSGTCLTKVEGVNSPLIKSLYRAAAALYRADLWKRLRPEHLIGVKVGKDSDWSGKKQPYPCVQFVGGDGGDLGFHMFRSESDAKKMTGSRETIRVPNIELLRVTFQVESLMLPLHRKMIKSLSLEGLGTDRFPVIDIARCTSSGRLQFRNPTLEELRFLYAFSRGISLVHPLLQQDYDAGPKWSKLICFVPFIETVDVDWTPEMAKGNDLVAVTVSHPPGQGYKEKGSSMASLMAPKFVEPPEDDLFDDVDVNSTGMRQCAACEKQVNGDYSVGCNRCRALVYCGSLCQKQHWEEAHKFTCGL